MRVTTGKHSADTVLWPALADRGRAISTGAGAHGVCRGAAGKARQAIRRFKLLVLVLETM